MLPTIVPASCPFVRDVPLPVPEFAWSAAVEPDGEADPDVLEGDAEDDDDDGLAGRAKPQTDWSTLATSLEIIFRLGRPVHSVNAGRRVACSEPIGRG